MLNQVELQAALAVGTVESVSPAEITIALEIEAPQAVALNAGTPSPFPKINSYLLIPTQAGAIVGQVAWVGIEKSPYPKRKGLNDFGLVDLPYPLRRLKLVPLGMLRTTRRDGQSLSRLMRGVAIFPSVGDAAVLPTPEQLRAIVETDPKDAKVLIGRSALADNTEVRVHPDKLFGRHLAVLGNTGSGKSCSVAGMVRWSIEAASKGRDKLNARFVILDPNGEYREAFKNMGTAVRVVSPHVEQDEGEGVSEVKPLTLPAWLWTANEWSAILAAAPGVQQPLLVEAIRKLRAQTEATVSGRELATKTVHSWAARFAAIIASPADAFATDNQSRTNARTIFGGLGSACEHLGSVIEAGDLRDQLQVVREKCKAAFKCFTGFDARNELSMAELEAIADPLKRALDGLPSQLAVTSRVSEAPIQFDVSELPKELHRQALASRDNRAFQNISSLLTRLDTLLHDPRLNPILVPGMQPTLLELLRMYLGTEDGEGPQIVLVDLSLVPSDVMHVVVATLTRLLFEALQRYHKIERHSLPTVVVLEEAHTFIQRGHDDPNATPTPTQMCRRLFERVAREGRKFGMGLVLASQRPSEISPTVLSQCNTFLLHRLVNDDDQDLVRRLVPDTLASLFKELPVLPSQHAVLLGHASPVPKMLVMRHLPEDQRPRSDDPPFWKVWTEGFAHGPRLDNVVRDWLVGDTVEPQQPSDLASAGDGTG